MTIDFCVGVDLLGELNEWEKMPCHVDDGGGKQPVCLRREGLACPPLSCGDISRHGTSGLIRWTHGKNGARWKGTTKDGFISQGGLGCGSGEGRGCHNVRNQDATLNFPHQPMTI